MLCTFFSPPNISGAAKVSVGYSSKNAAIYFQLVGQETVEGDELFALEDEKVFGSRSLNFSPLRRICRGR